jgi:hypothetical protein
MAANYSDRAIRANRHPNPDLIEFSASLANTPAYFVSDQRGLSCCDKAKCHRGSVGIVYIST